VWRSPMTVVPPMRLLDAPLTDFDPEVAEPIG
jgi:hypothetical protein